MFLQQVYSRVEKLEISCSDLVPGCPGQGFNLNGLLPKTRSAQTLISVLVKGYEISKKLASRRSKIFFYAGEDPYPFASMLPK